MTSVLAPQTGSCDRLTPDLAAGARLVLCDLDGCLVSEGRAFPDAAAFAAACADRLWIVSNNSTHSAGALAAELPALGLHIPAERILLAGEQTLKHIAVLHPGAGVALFAGDCLQERARKLGLRTDSATPEIVVLCRDPRFGIDDLDRLTAHLGRGARLWVSNLDRSHPGLDGRPVPETGALLAAVTAVLGEIAFDSIGKPHPHLARLALAATGTAAAEAIFIGDNPATDGRLARDAGIPFAHLLREGAAP